MRRLVTVVAALSLALAVSPGRASGGCDWRQYGNGPGHAFAQAAHCTSITPLTVGALVPKWVIETGSPVTASPAVADGTVYVGANAGTFYAIDAETGAIRWTFDVTDGNRVGFGKIVSSAAVADVAGSRVVLFGGGATLYMLDAANGSVLAAACTDPRAPTATRCAGSRSDIEVQSSPAVVEVDGETWALVGMDVHNDRDIGRTGVIAFRIVPASQTTPWKLETIWKFDPENRQTYTDANTADPLTHGHGTGSGCAGVWSSPAVDPDGDMVFFGTSSCSVDGVDAGESLYGITLRQGLFRWRYNPRVDRGESLRFDDDFGASPNLLPFGRVGGAGKDGWYYGLGRTRPDADAILPGEFATQHGQAGHVTTDFAIGGTIGTPAVGEVFDEPAIFATTAISTPIGTPLDDTDENVVDRSLAGDPGRMFSIHAISAVDGRMLWRSPLSRASYAAPSYARGLVYVPSTVDFAVNIFHADTGALLRRLPLNGPPSSGAAIVGDSIYLGTGTSVDPFPFEDNSGIWAWGLPG